jgi:hypothetical protein
MSMQVQARKADKSTDLSAFRFTTIRKRNLIFESLLCDRIYRTIMDISTRRACCSDEILSSPRNDVKIRLESIPLLTNAFSTDSDLRIESRLL